MKFVKRSNRHKTKLSIILLDWSVRESFHLLHYLFLQNVPRDTFEVIIIEYYSRISDAIRMFEDFVDTWVLLEMPDDCYYHKHLMYNAGIVLANGEICVICDSDAMVQTGFLRAIMRSFASDLNQVLHLDQFRNMRKDFYPFNYPSFHDVLGTGCINNIGGMTAGILDAADPIHTRNYGACMCAHRDALIDIGGADEHVDFLGHICGPYDMTFRLVNSGLSESWHQTEFMYHTWHPGQAGVDNYLGPHDGRHMSSTSLAALSTGRVFPLIENPSIRTLRLGHARTPDDEVLRRLIKPEYRTDWLRANAERGALAVRFDESDLCIGTYRGFAIYCQAGLYYAHLLVEGHAGPAGNYQLDVRGGSLAEVKGKIESLMSQQKSLTLRLVNAVFSTWQTYGRLLRLIRHITKRIMPRVVAAPKPKLNVFSKTLQLWKRVGKEQEGEKLEDFILNLRCLDANNDGSASLVGEPVVVLQSFCIAFYLKLLRSMQLIPRVRIEVARTHDDVVRLLRLPRPHDNAPDLVMSQLVYWRCYSLVAGTRQRHRLHVV